MIRKIFKNFLEISIDRYMCDGFSKSRFGMMMLLLILYVCLPIFAMFINPLHIWYNYMYVYIVLLLIFVLIYSIWLTKNLSIIDEFSYGYIIKIIRENNSDIEEVKKKILIGKESLPLVWIAITIGIGLIEYIFQISSVIPVIYKNQICILGWLYVLVCLVVIIFPNYTFYTYSSINYKKIIGGKIYEVKIYDGDNLLNKYMMNCKEMEE